MEQFATRLGGNTAIVDQVMKMFVDQYGNKPDLLREPLESGDVEKMFHTAHSIKGALANMCADEDAAIAAAVETPARAGTMPDESLVAELEQCVNAISDQIEAHLGGT